MASLITGWLLAMLLGARHASEPDHVVAVSTIVAGSPNARRAAWLGAFWGVGHSIALLFVGATLMWLHLTLPERIAALFELAVAAMLLFLGIRCIVRAFAAFSGARVLDSPVPVPHTHHDGTHHHDHSHERARPTLALARRPLTIGLVHGLAGSGALSALALSNMPSFATALVYILCFGTGSVMGMMALSGLAGVPLAQLGRRGRAQGCLFACAGVSSLVLGVLWGWPLVGQIASS